MATKRKYRSSSPPPTPLYQKPVTLQKDNEAASNASKSLVNKKKELALLFIPKVLPEPPFRAVCTKAVEHETYNMHPMSERNEDKVQKDVHLAVKQEIIKHSQARLATVLARNTAYRLLGDKNTEKKGGSESEEKFVLDKKYTFIEFGWLPSSDEKYKIIKLTGVTFFPEVDGQDGDDNVGTLEAHLNGMRYTSSNSHFRLHFLYKSVKEAFFQLEDGKNTPTLLHFLFHIPIVVGLDMKTHIQFRLVPTVVEQKGLDGDSVKFEKEKQTWDRVRSKDLQKFVSKVECKLQALPSQFRFREVYKHVEFHGIVFSKTSAVFVMTFTLLFQLANTPFVVVNLQDIEIVNLAKLRPGVFDMTIVFRDFNCDVLQIRSIPLDSLNGIKEVLDFAGVKFYENNMDPDWNSIVKNITDFPEKFIQEGGWDAYKLEDNATSLYYRHYNLEESQVVYDKDDYIDA